MENRFKPELREKTFTIRMTEQEAKTLERVAGELEISRSRLIRTALNDLYIKLEKKRERNGG